MKAPAETRGTACIYCYCEGGRCLLQRIPVIPDQILTIATLTRSQIAALRLIHLQKERIISAKRWTWLCLSQSWQVMDRRSESPDEAWLWITSCSVPRQCNLPQVPILIPLSAEGSTHASYKPLDLLFFSLAELAEGELSFGVFFLVFFLKVSSSSSSSLSSSVPESTKTGTS